MKLFLVDDEPVITECLEALIKVKFKDIDIRCFENGKLALDRFNEEGADIIITDLKMPVMSGYQLIDEIEKSSNSKPPILIITGYMTNAVNEIKYSGPLFTAKKPYEFKDVEMFLTNCIEKIAS